MDKKFKDFPTDEDYDEDYWEDFLKKQLKFKNEIMSRANEAGDTSELLWLQNQMMIIGKKQYDLKSWIMKTVFNKLDMSIDWGDKTPDHLRQQIMATECAMPNWQKREALYIIDMYHDMLVEMDDLYKRRERGQ